MLNKATIFHTAHASARYVKANGCKDSYARLFRLHLRFAWQAAKRDAEIARREALAATNPKAIRIEDLERTIFSEECRSRVNFAFVARLRGELAELRAA